jgi:hypothetical protein
MTSMSWPPVFYALLGVAGVPATVALTWRHMFFKQQFGAGFSSCGGSGNGFPGLVSGVVSNHVGCSSCCPATVVRGIGFAVGLTNAHVSCSASLVTAAAYFSLLPARRCG